MRSKIEIDGSILEQFNFGCELSFDGQPDFDKRINSFQRRHYQKAFKENSYRHPKEML